VIFVLGNEVAPEVVEDRDECRAVGCPEALEAEVPGRLLRVAVAPAVADGSLLGVDDGSPLAGGVVGGSVEGGVVGGGDDEGDEQTGRGPQLPGVLPVPSASARPVAGAQHIATPVTAATTASRRTRLRARRPAWRAATSTSGLGLHHEGSSPAR
jgi:hypothetical protein